MSLSKILQESLKGLKVHDNLHNGNCYCELSDQCQGKLESFISQRDQKILEGVEEKIKIEDKRARCTMRTLPRYYKGYTDALKEILNYLKE